ncbi:hypothetical protein X777_06188 [Ooceraea biroi]|uniref:Transposable element Tc3 transposase n=1 Tax=Ooceraea biroi TaxID=2015173 RepID=A0A026WF07_OOCBI|nr:hypothetical protein X777_06188 [Ooceraea biroi]
MENVPLQFRQNSWIQLDGCPSHYARQVRNWLDEHYAHRWIDRGGPVFWPPRSPDLTPLDFYLWGTLKNKVYSTEVISLEDLKQRITTSGNKKKFLYRVCLEMLYYKVINQY